MQLEDKLADDFFKHIFPFHLLGFFSLFLYLLDIDYIMFSSTIVFIMMVRPSKY